MAALLIDDLHDALTLAYDTVNHRETKALQQAEIFALLTPAVLRPVALAIDDELRKLNSEGDEGSWEDLPTHYGFSAYANGAAILSGSTALRCSFLYELLVELLGVRLRERKRLRRHLWVKAGAEIVDWKTVAAQLSTLHNILDRGPAPTDINTLRDLDAHLTTLIPAIRSHYKGQIGPKSLIKAVPQTAAALTALMQVVEKLNRQYVDRCTLMMTRLGVTAQAFMWSSRAVGQEEAICADFATALAHADRYTRIGMVSLYLLLAADKSVLQPPKVTAATVPSPLKKLLIGSVPSRGGVPEGFAAKEVKKDVQKANQALQAKDAPSGRGGGNTNTQWVGNAAAGGGESPARKRVWTAPEKGGASRKLGQRGGRYHGVTRGYMGEGRKPFPGYDDTKDEAISFAERDETAPALSHRLVVMPGRGSGSAWGSARMQR